MIDKKPLSKTPSKPGDCEDWAEYVVTDAKGERRPMAEVIEVKPGECTRYKRDGDKLATDAGALVVETVKGSFKVAKP